MLGNLNINTVSKEGAGEENSSDICPYEPGSVLNNGTVEEIHVFFRANSESLDINDMSDAATDAKSTFEQDMCLEGSHDFEDDKDCNLSPDLLRMVEQDEKQILPYKKQIMRFGYCWSTMKGDCISYTKRCHKFQNYGNKISMPHLSPHDISVDFLYVGTPTEATLFSLIYGMEAASPIEVETYSFRVLPELKLDKTE
ncbi:trans-resveratrol di-O-methyltransferase-like [Gossypium australe]|uniref:Trans-resveratrol di-O-methyltransferase-like n=1 Tax=Gossypium australe TaxID=47621 RepID=A0A5B6VE06_9ROSI|nr:trans-resveratrol di-O-methyltransferase-like [Gossypium australe]